jgi:hypothetical protein
MPPTTCLHESLAHPSLQQADLLFHHPIAFDPATRGFTPHADGRETTSLRLLRWGEFTATGVFLGLAARDPREKEALEALRLRETTAGWRRRARQLRQVLIRRVALTGGAQDAHGTSVIPHKEVFERVALLLTTVIRLLVRRVFRTVEWPFSTIRPTRGGVGSSCDGLLASRAATSSAVRAGRRSWSAQA